MLSEFQKGQFSILDKKFVQPALNYLLERRVFNLNTVTLKESGQARNSLSKTSNPGGRELPTSSPRHFSWLQGKDPGIEVGGTPI